MKMKVVKYTQMDKAVINATRSTINKLLKKANTEASKAVRKVYNIKAKTLKEYVSIYKATNNKLKAEVRVYKKRLPIELFQPKIRQKRIDARSNKWKNKRIKRNVLTIRIKKTSGRKQVGRAFMPTKSAKYKGKIYKRVGKERIPFKRLYTIGPAIMYQKEALKVMEKAANENVGKTMAHELKYYSEKFVKK